MQKITAFWVSNCVNSKYWKKLKWKLANAHSHCQNGDNGVWGEARNVSDFQSQNWNSQFGLADRDAQLKRANTRRRVECRVNTAVRRRTNEFDTTESIEFLVFHFCGVACDWVCECNGKCLERKPKLKNHIARRFAYVGTRQFINEIYYWWWRWRWRRQIGSMFNATANWHICREFNVYYADFLLSFSLSLHFSYMTNDSQSLPRTNKWKWKKMKKKRTEQYYS